MAFTKIAAAGIGSTETVTLHSLEVLNNATVGGVLTYEDVTNVDSIGIVTARAGVLVGSGITLSKDGDIFSTGVTTTGSLVSSGAISGTTGTFTGDVDIADKIIHTGDTNTAIRFPSADTFTVETGGTEALRIDSSANVNLGASAANTAIQASGPFSGATPKLEIKLGGASNSYTRLINIANPSGATGSETLGRVGIKLALGNESNATETAKAGIIYAESTSNFNNSTSLCFATNNTERFRIKSDGDVGIGTDNPSQTLHVNESSEANIRIQGGADYFDLRVKDSDDAFSIHKNIAGGGSSETLRITSDGHLRIANDTGRIQLGTGQDLQLIHDGSASKIIGKPELMIQSDELTFRSENGTSVHAVINSSGQVGIGTNIPGASLSVNGNIRFAAGTSVGGPAHLIIPHDDVTLVNNASATLSFGARFTGLIFVQGKSNDTAAVVYAVASASSYASDGVSRLIIQNHPAANTTDLTITSPSHGGTHQFQLNQTATVTKTYKIFAIGIKE